MKCGDCKLSINAQVVLCSIAEIKNTDAPGAMICKPCHRLYACVQEFTCGYPMGYLRYEACAGGSEAD